MPLEVHIREGGSATVIELVGTLDSSLPTETRQRILSLIKLGCRVVVDLSRLCQLSGTGLRMLLLLSRYVQLLGGTIAGAGASQELRDIAEAAGFLHLFQQAAPAAARATPAAPPMVRVDIYPTHHHAGFALRPGVPLPFGATMLPRGINFSVYSRYAYTATLVLFEPGVVAPVAEIPFPPEFRIGDVFAMMVFDLDPDNLEYGFRLDGPDAPAEGQRFDVAQILFDPMARSVSGRDVWGSPLDPSRPCPYRSRIVAEDFDWESDRPLELPIEDLVIYEMHVRGFTRSPTSGVKFPGTYAGIREKIPYLKALGVNCVELLPVFEFDELENLRSHPLTGERLYNYWGYSTVGFYAPKSGYAATGRVGMQADEFKALVKDLHQNGIELILDVVFNHTAEGNEQGPTISFRGLDNRTYYMLTPDGHYYNFSGCGNTLNCNHPVVRDLVLGCLRHWVAEYHVDGFRFDLASILGRDADGTPLPNPPLLEALAMDPVLGKTKLIAFRQRHPALRQARHAGSGASETNTLQVTWHGTRAWRPDWAPHSRVLACLLCGAGAAESNTMYVAMNMYWEPLAFELPSPPSGQRWHVFANTALAPPADIWEPGQEPPLPEPREVFLEGRTILVLVAR